MIPGCVTPSASGPCSYHCEMSCCSHASWHSGVTPNAVLVLRAGWIGLTQNGRKHFCAQVALVGYMCCWLFRLSPRSATIASRLGAERHWFPRTGDPDACWALIPKQLLVWSLPQASILTFSQGAPLALSTLQSRPGF